MSLNFSGTHIPGVIPLLDLTFVMLLFSCIVQSDQPNETIYFIHPIQSDTIAPWGAIEAVFSEQLTASTVVRFIFDPPYYSYALTINESHDTVRLQCVDPLQGDSRYVLRLKDTVYSQSGALFLPARDSIVFFTYPAEQEPNGSQTIADTLQGRCFGSIATVNDTDWYVIINQSPYAVFLNSEGSQTTLYIGNATDSTKASGTFKSNDTLVFADGLRTPIFVGVCAYHRSVGGYYEVGIVTNDMGETP